jgi:hypothetical protein
MVYEMLGLQPWECLPPALPVPPKVGDRVMIVTTAGCREWPHREYPRLQRRRVAGDRTMRGLRLRCVWCRRPAQGLSLGHPTCDRCFGRERVAALVAFLVFLTLSRVLWPAGG